MTTLEGFVPKYGLRPTHLRSFDSPTGHFIGGLDKELSAKLVRVLRGYGFRLRGPHGSRRAPGGYRVRDQVGGWLWGVMVDLDKEWLADLAACTMRVSLPKDGPDLLDEVLEGLFVQARLDETAIDSVWRLQGGEGIDALAKANGYTGPSLGYTYSFLGDRE